MSNLSAMAAVQNAKNSMSDQLRQVQERTDGQLSRLSRENAELRQQVSDLHEDVRSLTSAVAFLSLVIEGRTGGEQQ